MYILTLAEYVFLSPDSIARLPGPTSLLARDSGTSPGIEPNHTKSTGRFIYCCLAAPLSVPGRLSAGAGGLLDDSAAAGQLHPTRRLHDQLSAHQQHQPQPPNVTQCACGGV